MDLATTLAGANRYVDAVCAEDCAAVAGIFADDVARHPAGLYRAYRAVATVGEVQV